MILGIIPNLRKPELGSSLQSVVEWSASNDTQLLISTRITEHFPELENRSGITVVAEEEMADQADFLLAMGGDGTILAALRHAGGRQLPVLGINLGSLGFLADTSTKNMAEALDLLEAGT